MEYACLVTMTSAEMDKYDFRQIFWLCIYVSTKTK